MPCEHLRSVPLNWGSVLLGSLGQAAETVSHFNQLRQLQLSKRMIADSMALAVGGKLHLIFD